MRPHNRKALDEHPLRFKMELIEGSSTVTFRKGVTPGLPFRPPASTVAALVH
ncbi:cephalosporin hydroxylase family protein [Synechococcus sp. RS9909]|uniref:cephalosporin hydroxylase family protein n=1 Tax=Synechococcus sp. RS9909 TaxID=221352 RepID=UPI002105BC99|nr:cephalosporin hydroxylase family protein [Synechococcus sp. RS9909]